MPADCVTAEVISIPMRMSVSYLTRPTPALPSLS